jgi:UMF1 family MFS transporter
MSFGKVLFAEIIPEGSESEFFALAAIVDRGSSWIGPILVGSVTNALNIRYGMASISILFIIGLPLLYMVDVKKGVVDARAYARRILEDSDLLFDDENEAFLNTA